MSKKRLVLSLGHKDLGTNLPEQKVAVVKTAPVTADFAEEGWQVTVTHSNAPQANMIRSVLSEFAAHREGHTPSPLPVRLVMNRGYIGYDLQNGFRSEPLSHSIYKCVLIVMTEITVDPYNRAFHQPLKTIGCFVAKEEAEAEDTRGNHTVEISGKDYQHVVPALNPAAVVEIDTIKAPLGANQVVICRDDDGVSVLEQGTTPRGVGAVIGRDLTSGLLVWEVDVDVLLIPTAIDNVTLDFDTPTEKAISETGIDDAKAYMEVGQFKLKSMFLKVKAAVDPAGTGKNRATTITNFARAGQALRGRVGMRIS